MVLDKFGRSSHSEKKRKNLLPMKTIAFTEHGNIDCEHKKICNVADPNDGHDAVNLSFMQSKTVGFTYYGNINCEKKQLVNVADPTVDTDAVNRKYVKSEMAKYQVELDTIKKTMTMFEKGLQQAFITIDDKISKENEQIQTKITNDLQKLKDDLKKRIEILWAKIAEQTSKLNDVKNEIDKSTRDLVDNLQSVIEAKISRMNQTINVTLTPRFSELSLKIGNVNDDLKTLLKKEIDKLRKEIKSLDRKP